MLVRGAVYHHADMTFYDGEKGKKYIVLLNNPGNADPCCFVKVTSQQHDGTTTPGCQGKRLLFHLPQNTDYFPKPTWVQLFDVYPYAKDALHKKNGITFCGTLKPDTIDKIVRCLHDYAMDDIPRNLHPYLQLSPKAEINKLAEMFNKKNRL